ncbi:heterokaryon incompatibility protein-domain-containing protein [Pisolithus tinctorius]|nr:heterokaryon incompatibility protein-domain-containing protein [Pisolithus tinctorius]
MKFKSRVPMTSSNASPVTHFDAEQLIRNVAFEALKTMPTRLLHTHTGVLCNRHAQLTRFMNSKQYKQLVSLCTTCDPDQRMELVRTAVLKYFQYVTLSHRWGDDEPSLRDIEGHLIYDMSAKEGFEKLQAFCTVACEQGFLWAWSDTCCIDKDSSAELQEAIGSMFTWYRRSSLTVVYLSDVQDTGSLGNSEWFRRGWTLQELLAPRTVLFYTQDWSLYKNLTSSNHKTDIAVLEELERATGIESRFLTHFSPGMDDARSRLQWASSRRTTRPEDIAYSLFGIFNLHLPVLYGELAEKALGRLLAEIISQSGDISVLDWVGEASQFHSCFPAQITSFQMLPLLRSQPNAEELSAAISQNPSPTSSEDSYSPGDVYDFHSLTRVPLPRFLNRRLILPCIAHCVTVVHLKGSDPSAPSYTYSIQAFGLKPLEITLPNKLEAETRLQGSLQLVRPWHSTFLGSPAELDAVTEEQLLSTLERPFNALLLSQLLHNEHKRIASSIRITAQPIGRASILKSKIRIFNIV